MKKICFFDTETTGKANMKADPWLDTQPRIVQLAALLCTEDGKEMASINLLVAPAIPIEEEAAKIHGITNEFAAANGIDIVHAMLLFGGLVTLADLFVT
jgi:DNA polymerase-3 subunit epsilon